MPSVAAIVVTYNRKALLSKCLVALTTQTLQPLRILVVDNASTDGTTTMLTTEHWLDSGKVELLPLPSNLGGAGGFASGLRHAAESGAEWIWMMDDDAEAHPDALEKLMEMADDPSNIYCSLAVSGEDTSWATTLLDDFPRVTTRACAVPRTSVVASLPFLGFLIHRDLVRRIGLPDAEYFIAADDIEYCLRAKRAGAKLTIVGDSRIEHPKTAATTVCILGKRVVYLSLPPWKRYYDTRNRLLNARRYHGWRLLTQTIPGSLVRLLAALLHERRKLAQLWAFTAGFIDGLLGIKGRRHDWWRIPQ